MKRVILLITGLLLTCITLNAQQGRSEKELSGEGWRLWRDHAALWYNDKAFLPPVDVGSLPVNPPTCGWEKLQDVYDKIVTVPGTVEEHYWGEIGGALPDTGGNYVGVSWWSTTFTLDADLKNKLVTIYFESVNLRAEVFINGKLVGYDVIGNTPFEVNITDAVVVGQENRLDVRITDPVGNFTWDDNVLMRWGENLVPAVHGFGGITGPVILRVTDRVYINDIYVQNQPDPRTVKVFVSLNNVTGKEQKGELSLVLHKWRQPAEKAWDKTIPVNVTPGENSFSFTAEVPRAQLWELSGYRNLEKAAMYEANASFSSSNNKISDTRSQRFGFRWFDIGEKNGDARFYLNGKRIFIIAAMTRGFWPVNGIFATPEMARRDMEALVDLGLNMMLLHRAIGQPPVIEYADTMGLLTYEEPGGYRITPNEEDNIEGPDQQAFEWRREKLRRMVIRDRSFPSMLIYNLKNEATKPSDEDDVRNVQMVHNLDPSRIITYNSDRNRQLEYFEKINSDPYKLHMRPFDDKLYYEGWWDQHHWFAYPGYVDGNYNNPDFYLRGVVNAPRVPLQVDSLYRLDKKEIIFFGEEGAFGTMVRLEKIRDELLETGASGFRELEHIDWFDHYDRFLDETGFRSAYPSVDELTLSMGRNLHYFQGRNIENIRMSNIADAYNMNGWGSAATRTDVVDMYRYPTADPAILQHYTQPLYVAVKIRNKVLPTGSAPVADFFIINEADLKGKYRLKIEFRNPAEKVILTKEVDVDLAGGEEFGQLLFENLVLPGLDKPGYYHLNADIETGGEVKASGFDDIYVVDIGQAINYESTIAVIEESGIVRDFLKESRDITVSSLDKTAVKPDVIIIGDHEPGGINGETMENIFELVKNGTTLIVLENADYFAEKVNSTLKRRPAYYKGGGFGGGPSWRMGRLFVGNSSYLEGLPQAQGMSWEYQCFYSTEPMGRNGQVSGIRIDNWGSEWIVACGKDFTKEIFSSLNRVQVGKGQVFLSTLNILPNLKSAKPNSVVAKKLFLNLLEH
ncbi:glycoside hydrolase family 2 protein [Bacteroidota bacterium]